MHRSEAVGEGFAPWLDRFARRAAVNFTLSWNASLGGYVPPHPDPSTLRQSSGQASLGTGLPAPFTTARELRQARERAIALRRDIRQRMVFLQEEGARPGLLPGRYSGQIDAY